MKPTRPPALIAIFLIAALVARFLLRSIYDDVTLPTGPVITIAIIAVMEVGIAWTTRNRLRGKRLAKPIDPLGVARLAVLARASSTVGAIAAGAWAGILVYLVRLPGGSSAVAHDRWLAVVGIVTGGALVAAALWLEWVCRVHPPKDRGTAAPAER